MNHQQLQTLIAERGPLAVANLVRLPLMPALQDAMNLTLWRVIDGNGSLLFARVDGDGVYTSETRLLCLNAENTEANRAKWAPIVAESPDPTVFMLAPFVAPF